MEIEYKKDNRRNKDLPGLKFKLLTLVINQYLLLHIIRIIDVHVFIVDSVIVIGTILFVIFGNIIVEDTIINIIMIVK